MYRIIIIIIASLLNSQANAITLEEALASAYNNNDDLKLLRRSFLSVIEQFPQALSTFLPDVNASFGTSTSKQKIKSQYGNGAPSNETKTFSKGIGLGQNIFNGGKGVAALKAAQSGFRSARAQYYANEQSILYSAINAYVTCYVNKEKYDIATTSVKSNQKQLEAMQEKLNVGETTQTEVASAKAALALAETKKLSAYAEFQSAKANFTQIFGIEPIDIILPEIPANLPATFEVFIMQSMKTNQDIEFAKHNITSAKANEHVAKADLLPKVDFNVSAGRSYYDPENGSSNINNIDIISGISVSVPIIPKGGVQYSTIRQAKLASRSSVVKLDQTQKQVNANCISSWEGFNTARSSIGSAVEGVEAAQIAYDGSVQEELVGTKTILDVLQAEDRLNDTKISKVQATQQYILAAYQMKALLGQLTAKSLKLKVDYFEPEKEFNKVKAKIIGF